MTKKLPLIALLLLLTGCAATERKEQRRPVVPERSIFVLFLDNK